MNEYEIIWQITGGGIGLVLASTLYAIGGRKGKWHRRFLASLVLAATVNILCAIREIWNPWMMAVYLPLAGGFSLGYSADNLSRKVWRRSVYVLAVLMSGVLMAFLLGGNAWLVLVPHVFVGLSSIWMGVRNPVYAPAEEFLICMVLNLFLIAYSFIT